MAKLGFDPKWIRWTVACLPTALISLLLTVPTSFKLVNLIPDNVPVFPFVWYVSVLVNFRYRFRFIATNIIYYIFIEKIIQFQITSARNMKHKFIFKKTSVQ